MSRLRTADLGMTESWQKGVYYFLRRDLVGKDTRRKTGCIQRTSNTKSL